MDSVANINTLLGVDIAHLVYTLIIVVTLLGLLCAYLLLRLHQLHLQYTKMMRGSTGESIEKMMLERIREIEELKSITAELHTACERIAEQSRKHLQQLGLVRFNAFDNTGSDLSFSVAVLDADDTGVVVSGIYGREESRVYAKPIAKGESSYLLTKEEKQALVIAQKK